MRCHATFALIHLSCHQQSTPMLQAFALDNLDHKAILVGKSKGSAQNRSSAVHTDAASFALDNLDHKVILVGENKGSAQNRSRFWTWALPCNFCLDSPVMPSAVHVDAATCGGESQHP